MTTPDAPLIAHVAVDVPLPHLDRVFDYLVTPAQADSAAVGSRVRIRFAGKLRDGYILALDHVTEVAKPAPLERVPSPEVVLTPPVAGLVRAVAGDPAAAGRGGDGGDGVGILEVHGKSARSGEPSGRWIRVGLR